LSVGFLPFDFTQDKLFNSGILLFLFELREGFRGSCSFGDAQRAILFFAQGLRFWASCFSYATPR